MSALDAVLPPRPELVDPFTGEVLDRDDLTDLKFRLASVEGYLESEYDKNRKFYEAKRLLAARVGELRPTDLPARKHMTASQRALLECPRCATRFPRRIVEEAE